MGEKQLDRPALHVARTMLMAENSDCGSFLELAEAGRPAQEAAEAVQKAVDGSPEIQLQQQVIAEVVGDEPVEKEKALEKFGEQAQ
eukprot:11219944-Lingulodinium_polyedra.AAC.1